MNRPKTMTTVDWACPLLNCKDLSCDILKARPEFKYKIVYFPFFVYKQIIILLLWLKILRNIKLLWLYKNCKYPNAASCKQISLIRSGSSRLLKNLLKKKFLQSNNKIRPIKIEKYILHLLLFQVLYNILQNYFFRNL